MKCFETSYKKLKMCLCAESEIETVDVIMSSLLHLTDSVCLKTTNWVFFLAFTNLGFIEKVLTDFNTTISNI